MNCWTFVHFEGEAKCISFSRRRVIIGIGTSLLLTLITPVAMEYLDRPMTAALTASIHFPCSTVLRDAGP